jgi:hypothetical protein
MCPIEFWFFFKNDLLPTWFASLTQKDWCAYLHSRICIHRRYSQLPHIHNHGLAILACMTPFWNMHPPLVYPQLWLYHLIWKEFFEEVIFLLKYHQNPWETKHRKKKKRERKHIEKEKKKKRGKKKKLQESLQIKGKSIF